MNSYAEWKVLVVTARNILKYYDDKKKQNNIAKKKAEKVMIVIDNNEEVQEFQKDTISHTLEKKDVIKTVNEVLPPGIGVRR